MPDLFKEIIPSILKTKKNAFEEDYNYNDYNPYIVNRALSYHIDCLLYANEMNIHNSLDKDMQYHYLLNSIKPAKRKFQPWQKVENNSDLDSVRKYYGYSIQKAKDALKILTKEQVEDIKDRMTIGGTK